MARAPRITAMMTTLICSLSVVAGQRVRLDAQSPSFRSGVDIVTINVTVTDDSRRYIADLVREEFQIFEDGRRQQVMFFQSRRLPLALALLMDTSASMTPHLGVAQEAAVEFVRALGPTDMASVVDFDTGVRVGQEFTSDRIALERAIRGTTADGSTALSNAVYIALTEMNKIVRDQPIAEPRRRAIVILSDGEDTSSLMTFDDVLDAAARSDTAIYAIGLFSLQTTAIPKSGEPQYILRRLAQQTGGRAFFVYAFGRQRRRLEEDRGDPNGGRLAPEGGKDALGKSDGRARFRGANKAVRCAGHPMLRSMRTSAGVRLQIVVCVRSLVMF